MNIVTFDYQYILFITWYSNKLLVTSWNMRAWTYTRESERASKRFIHLGAHRMAQMQATAIPKSISTTMRDVREGEVGSHHLPFSSPTLSSVHRYLILQCFMESPVEIVRKWREASGRADERRTLPLKEIAWRDDDLSSIESIKRNRGAELIDMISFNKIADWIWDKWILT